MHEVHTQPHTHTPMFRNTKLQFNVKLLEPSHHGNEASDEAEVSEVVGVDGRSRVYLQTVVVFTGILKQTVHGVQHLMRQQEEPLPTRQRQRRRESVTQHSECCL